MRYAVIESIGAMTLMAAATLPLSCVPAPTPVRGDLQPLIATAGTYALMGLGLAALGIAARRRRQG